MIVRRLAVFLRWSPALVLLGVVLGIGFGDCVAAAATTTGGPALVHVYDGTVAQRVEALAKAPFDRRQVLRLSVEPVAERDRGALSDACARFATEAAGGSGSEIFRAVEPGGLADLMGSGLYRALPGQTGKYSFPASGQAENFAQMMAKNGHGSFSITSGCIDPKLLGGVEKIDPVGEGQARFIPEELPPCIDDIVIHGPPG